MSRRVALVTGAGRGIGLGIARALAADGMDIAILDVLPMETVAENLRMLQESGAAVHYFRGDVTSREDRRKALEALRERFGGLHVLVNNAGVAPKVRGYSRRRRGQLRVGDENQSAGAVFSDPGRRALDDRAEAAGCRLARVHHQYFVHLGHGGLDQPRRVLHLQGRRQHGDPAVGRATRRVRHPRL